MHKLYEQKNSAMPILFYYFVTFCPLIILFHYHFFVPIYLFLYISLLVQEEDSCSVQVEKCVCVS